MKSLGLLENRRFVLATVLVVAANLLIVASKMLVAGQPQTVTLINDTASVVCSLIASVLFVRVWLSTSDKDVSRRIWGLVAVGLILWTLAEAIWGYYEVILNEDVPYPSIADLFWLLGYIPFYLAIVTRYRLFQPTLSRWQRLFIALFVVLFSTVISFYVLQPILADFDAQRIIESLLNLAYPLSDLILLILTLVIIFSLEEGRFVVTWRMFGIGLMIMAVGDLLFSYASWSGIYYPDGQLNAISMLIDSLYDITYLTLGLGIYTYSLISVLQQTSQINLVLRSLTKSNILVFVDKHGRILSMSDNLLNLVHASDQSHYIKKPLHETLGVDFMAVGELLSKTIKRGSLSNQPLTVRDIDKEPRNVWLTSFAIYDPPEQLNCIALILRTDLILQDEKPLTGEQQKLIDFYLTEAGTYSSEENRVIKAYFLEQINSLYSLVRQFSGAQVAGKLLEHLNQVAGRNKWPFTFSAEHISMPEEYEGQMLADLLSTLLHEAKNFAVSMTNLRVVEEEIKNLDANLSPDTFRYIDKYNLRGTMRPVF